MRAGDYRTGPVMVQPHIRPRPATIARVLRADVGRPAPCHPFLKSPALTIVLTVVCLLYQTEWPVWAALSLPSTEMMSCPCRGTEQCCCCRMKMKKDAARSAGHEQCHVESAQRPTQQTAQCVMEADDCGHHSPAMTHSESREPALIAKAAFISLITEHFTYATNSIALSSASTEPPFIPPRAALV